MRSKIRNTTFLVVAVSLLIWGISVIFEKRVAIGTARIAFNNGVEYSLPPFIADGKYGRIASDPFPIYVKKSEEELSIRLDKARIFVNERLYGLFYKNIHDFDGVRLSDIEFLVCTGRLLDDRAREKLRYLSALRVIVYLSPVPGELELISEQFENLEVLDIQAELWPCKIPSVLFDRLDYLRISGRMLPKSLQMSAIERYERDSLIYGKYEDKDCTQFSRNGSLLSFDIESAEDIEKYLRLIRRGGKAGNLHVRCPQTLLDLVASGFGRIRRELNIHVAVQEIPERFPNRNDGIGLVNIVFTSPNCEQIVSYNNNKEVCTVERRFYTDDYLVVNNDTQNAYIQDSPYKCAEVNAGIEKIKDIVDNGTQNRRVETLRIHQLGSDMEYINSLLKVFLGTQVLYIVEQNPDATVLNNISDKYSQIKEMHINCSYYYVKSNILPSDINYSFEEFYYGWPEKSVNFNELRIDWFSSNEIDAIELICENRSIKRLEISVGDNIEKAFIEGRDFDEYRVSAMIEFLTMNNYSSDESSIIVSCEDGVGKVQAKYLSYPEFADNPYLNKAVICLLDQYYVEARMEGCNKLQMGFVVVTPHRYCRFMEENDCFKEIVVHDVASIRNDASDGYANYIVRKFEDGMIPPSCYIWRSDLSWHLCYFNDYSSQKIQNNCSSYFIE